jgi:hypothetical protein
MAWRGSLRLVKDSRWYREARVVQHHNFIPAFEKEGLEQALYADPGRHEFMRDMVSRWVRDIPSSVNKWLDLLYNICFGKQLDKA